MCYLDKKFEFKYLTKEEHKLTAQFEVCLNNSDNFKNNHENNTKNLKK